MNTLEIRKLIRGNSLLNTQFGAVLSADELKTIDLTEKRYFVVNTQAKPLRGRHWVCLYINTSSNLVEYWDSIGNKPQYYGEYFHDFFKNVDYIYNERRLQGQENTCGHFCLYFMYHRHRQYTMQEIVNRLTPDPACNDIIVVNFVENCVK